MTDLQKSRYKTKHLQRFVRPRLETLEDRILLASGVSQAFLGKLYQDLLGRPVDAVGLSFWSNYLDQGGSTAVVANQIVASPEYLTDQVHALFGELLHRGADPAGQGFFQALLQNGGTLEQVSADMVGSAEYFKNRAGGSYKGFLDNGYGEALGRGADAGGRLYYLTSMANGASATKVATDLFTSTEHYQSLVQGFYKQYLHHPADTAGLSFFVSSLQQGATDQAVAAAVVSSDEYFNFNQFYVTQVYNDLLQRKADAGGLSYWTSFLDQGNGRTALVQQFTQTLEYQTVQVQNAYQTLLGHAADQNGLAAFVSQLQSGATVEQVEAQIAGSPEYFQKRGGGTKDGFLNALYHDALNRAVDSATRTTWDQALQNGASPTQIALSVLTSGEYQQDLVGSLFQRFLYRPADSTGLNSYVSALQQGVGQNGVIADLLASPEYFTDLTPDLSQGEVDFSGPYPNPAEVSFINSSGQQGQVLAFPGEVQVFFNSGSTLPEALAVIQAASGSILAQIPRIGYYLAGVTPGKEGAFVSRMQGNPLVEYVAPQVVGSLASSATFLDVFGLGATHGNKVDAAYRSEFPNGASVATVDQNVGVPILGLNSPFNFRIDRGIIASANQGPGLPILINLSVNGVWPTIDPKRQDYQTNPDLQEMGRANWLNFMDARLTTIAELPATDRQNLVITIAAGNNNMPIDSLLAVLRKDPRIADVLVNNVLIVTSNKVVANLGNKTDPKNPDPAVALVNNDLSVDGTSFAAPAALARIELVIAATGVSGSIALRAAKEAIRDHPFHWLVTAEAIAKAQAIVASTSTLSVRPISLSFSVVVGGGNPPAKGLVLSDTGLPGTSLSYTINTNNSRLTVAGPLTPIPAGGSNTYDVAFNAAGLAAGTYSATITFASASNTVIVPVTLTVTNDPTIDVQPTQLTFSAVEGGGNPSTQPYTIMNTGPAGSFLQPAVSLDATWLYTSSSSKVNGPVPTSIVQAGVYIVGLAAGTYQGTIAEFDPNATNLRKTIAVFLTITPQAPPGQPTSFDGSYLGTFTGTISDPLGKRSTSGQVAFTESNGIVTVTAPGVGGSGTTDTAGNVNFVAQAPSGSTVPSLPFIGAFSISPSGVISASGTFFVTYNNGAGIDSGTWQVFKQS